MKSLVSLAYLTVLLLAANCGSGSGASPGTEKGPCYGNNTCNAGLSCYSGLCVSAGTAGSPGMDGAAAPEAGGAGGLAVGGSGGTDTDGGPGAGGKGGQADSPDGPTSSEGGTGPRETGGATDAPNVPDGAIADAQTGRDRSLSDGGPFPAGPIVDPNSPSPVPSNPESQFSGAPSGTGPCVVEPENGALYPNNWARPRIMWKGTTGLTQITVHSAAIPNDLIVYTTGNYWIMDKSIWTALSQEVQEQDISVTVRSAGGGATTVAFQVAPVAASGSILFLALDPAAVGNMDVTTTKDTSAYLRGFSVGDDNTVDLLKQSQVQQPSRDQLSKKRTPTCIGCHSPTPDSGFVAFVDNWPWNSVIAGIKAGSTGNQLTDLSAGGLADLNRPWTGAATFSPRAWAAGRRIMVTTSSLQDELAPWSTDNKQPAKLVWYNLDSPEPPPISSLGASMQPIAQLSAGNYGVIARNGDANGVAFPTWSHDGTTIIYSSTKGGCQDGRLGIGATDLFSVAYNDGIGGDAAPVPGASDKNWEEYYASYSPDDTMVLFDRVPAGSVMYANESAEMFFVPLGSTPGAGTAVRLLANDPVACTGQTSPGVNNHLPKWAPAAQSNNGSTYYWIVYSSNRAGLPCVVSQYDSRCHKISQLYLTAITLKNGTYTTYPSIYMWNQPTSSINLGDWGTSQIQ